MAGLRSGDVTGSGVECSSERVAVAEEFGIDIRVSWGGDPYRISSERGAVRGLMGWISWFVMEVKAKVSGFVELRLVLVQELVFRRFAYKCQWEAPLVLRVVQW